ncbi:MAG: hypothetical protein ACE5F9_07655 [Phycisphaerae bacterium]
MTILDGRVVVSILTVDKTSETVERLRDVGLAVESVAESANVIVGTVTRERLADLSLLDAVRRISSL